MKRVIAPMTTNVWRSLNWSAYDPPALWPHSWSYPTSRLRRAWIALAWRLRLATPVGVRRVLGSFERPATGLAGALDAVLHPVATYRFRRVMGNVALLAKALEAGSYDAAPTQLVQGCELTVEDLSNVMECARFDDSPIKLRRTL